MEKLIQIIIELILIASSLVKAARFIKIHGCRIGEDNSALCTSVPQCNDSSNEYLNDIKKYLFLNQINKIEKAAFMSCSYDNDVELKFNSINEIEESSFQNMNIKPNVKVSLILNADDHNKELIIRQNAFKGLVVGKNAKLTVQIANYDLIKIESNLIDDFIQNEKSEINFVFKTNNEIYFLTSKQIDVNPSYLTKSIVFKIEIFNSKNVFVDEAKYKYLSIDPLSEVAFIINSVSEVYLSKYSFDSLMVAYKAKFSFYISNAANVIIGEGLFQNLIQEDESLFLMLIEDLKQKRVDHDLSCFNIPENFLKNIKQNQNSLLQIHFLRFSNKYIMLKAKSIRDVIMNDKSKVQIYFKDIDDDIIFEEQSINHVQTNNGYFEIWVENHALNSYSQKDRVYFILNENSISTLFLSSQSYFRVGFHNSKSVFNLLKTSINHVHIDDFVDEQPGYRTKITVEIKNSENFRMNFDDELDHIFEVKIPMIIEIDDYMPSLQILNSDGTFDTHKQPGPLFTNQIELLQYELCQYSKLKTYLKENLFYFQEAFNLKSGVNATTFKCSSCLFLYLYRFIHRRFDFYDFRDHLPECFSNLFYKNLFSFDEKSYLEIDNRINYYWLLQKCDVVTGMRSINDSTSEKLIEKNICSKYFTNETSANKNCLSSESSNKSLIYYNQRIHGVILEADNVETNSPRKQASSILALIFVALIAVTCLAIIINVLYKRRYLTKPCLHLNLGNKKNFKLINMIKTLTDDVDNLEHQKLDEDLNSEDFDAKFTNDAADKDENIKLCNANATATNKMKSYLESKKKKIFKNNDKSRNNYQTINDDRLGKYKCLDETVNEENLSKKKIVNVLYDVNRNRTSLMKTASNDDEDSIYDEATIRLKTNPMHDLDKNFNKIKSKPVDV